MHKLLPATLLLMVVVPVFGDDAQKATKRSFEVKIETEMKADAGAEAELTNTVARFRYTYECIKQNATLTIDEIEIDRKKNGKDYFNSVMSRTRFRNSLQGVDYSAANAPPNVKQMMEASFGTPSASFSLDANGKETGRTILATKLGQQLIDRKMLANARAFHAPFYPGKEKWEARIEVGASENTCAIGNLTYEKQSATKSLLVFKVTGELKLEELKSPDGKMVMNGKHTISGEQTYDETKQEWVSGEWKSALAFEGVLEGKPLGIGKAKMILKMKMVE